MESDTSGSSLNNVIFNNSSTTESNVNLLSFISNTDSSIRRSSQNSLIIDESNVDVLSSISNTDSLIRRLRGSSSALTEPSNNSSINSIHNVEDQNKPINSSYEDSNTTSKSNENVQLNPDDHWNRRYINEAESSIENILIDEIPICHGEYSDSDEEDFYDAFFHENEIDGSKKNTNLDNVMVDECSNEPLDSHISMSKMSIMLAVLKFCSKYNVPNAGIVDLFKMLNMIMNKNIFPENNYQVTNLFSLEGCMEYHALCPLCKDYLGIFDKRQRIIFCESCDADINLKDPSYNDYFVTLDVASEIQSLIEANKDFYTDIVSRRNKQRNTTFQDIYDGQRYKQFLESLPADRKESYCTVTFNSDGSPVFKSSKYSIWPIQIVVNEIPLNVRSMTTITCALWFGRNKPNMTYFLRPFVDQINNMSENGITVQLNDEKKKIFVYALCCCVDSVARAPMQGTVQFNGYYGCNWCLHPGVSIRHDTGYSIKYPILEDFPERRTAAATLELMQRSVDSNVPLFGIKNVSPLIILNEYDIIDGFVPCALHCVDRGVGVQMTNYWCSSNQAYSIPKSKMKAIDQLLKNIKVPTQLTRLSRSLSDRAYWKAVEWCNWILFYSIPVLKLVSEEIPAFRVYLDHWLLLVQAYYILLQTEITLTEIRKADYLLKQFVYTTQILYSEDAMTYNVHQLLHLPQSVVDWGPLFSHSGYVFESGNGKIKKTIHAANGVLSQVCRYLSFQEAIRKLTLHEELNNGNSSCVQYIQYLDNNFTKNSIKFEYRYFGRTEVNENVLRLLQLSIGTVRAYKKIVKDGCPFKSCVKELYRSDNSFATLKNGYFIEIQQFLVDIANLTEYVAYKKVEVSSDDHLLGDETYCMKQVTEISQNIEITHTRNIDKTCVYLNFDRKNYISSVPNMYWR